jgi:hypothetical protein
MKKEKDKKKAMKLSNYDRTMALIRIPEYQQEYDVYARLLDIDKKKAKELGKRMAKKWKLYLSPGYEWLFPISIKNLEFFHHYFNKSVEVIDIKNADRLAEIYPHVKLKKETVILEAILNVHKNLFKKHKETTKEAFNLEKDISSERLKELFEPAYSYEGGKFLFLMIDLNQNEKTIIKELKPIITHYKKNMPINKSRRRDTLINPWEVYDMHQTYDMNFQQIAKQLSGINKTGKDGNPSYNERLMSWCKTVERACKKAGRIIKQVRKEAEQPA